MLNISEYLKLSQDKRQEHLRLDEDCIERGGQSMDLKGLLAHLHDTTIPTGHEAHVCHACHNAACSNPNHVYWGTPSENALDRMANGGSTIWEYTIAKYGEDGARKKQRRSKELASKAGKGNKGNTLTEEHKQNIARSVKQKYATGTVKGNGKNAGRKPATEPKTLMMLVEKHGIAGTAEILGITYDAAQSRYYRNRSPR